MSIHDIYSFLKSADISYILHEHPAVFTVEEANALLCGVEGQKTKNLFLRDKKGTQHFLVVAADDTRVDLKELGRILGVGNLIFASPERLKRYLGILPGAVSPLALLHDRDVHVKLIFDRTVWEVEFIQSHPLVNTQTLVLSHDALIRFLERTGHNPQVVDFIKGSLLEGG
jgi:Ala-tRNA(Pro) deacylase